MRTQFLYLRHRVETASNSLLFGFLGLLGHKSTPFNEAPFYHARPCTQDDFPHVTIPREGRHLDGQYNVIGSRTVASVFAPAEAFCIFVIQRVEDKAEVSNG
jgi:hypothetical protein